MGRIMSPHQVIEETDEFLQYLTTECGAQFEINKLDLRSIYTEGYTQSRQGGKRRKGTSFSGIFMCMRSQMTFTYIDGVCVFGSKKDVDVRSKLVTEEDKELWRIRDEIHQSHPYYCPTCSTDCQNEKNYIKHKTSRFHREQSDIQTDRKKRAVLVEDKGGLTVTSLPPAEADVINMVANKDCTEHCQITINNSNDYSMGLKIKPMSKSSVFVFMKDHEIEQGSNVITIESRPQSEFGFHFLPILLQFRAADKKDDVEIMKYLSLDVISGSDLYDALKCKGKYKKPMSILYRGDSKNTVKGVAPDDALAGAGLHMVPPPIYPIPHELKNQAMDGVDSDESYSRNKKLRALLEKQLEWNSYTEKFQTLLYLEEIQMQIDIRNYDMKNIRFGDEVRDYGKRLLALKVPGLAENRPSVLRGDCIFAHHKSDKQNRYSGIVHRVEQEQVLLGFNKWVVDRKHDLFDIEFTFHRLTMKVMHRATSDVMRDPTLRKVLFPPSTSPDSKQTRRPVKDLNWFNKKLNREQRVAVSHIVQGSSRPLPYLVYGPPGTGKTVTMCEAIKQVYNQGKEVKILVCAPENTAADYLVKNLLNQSNIEHRHILRMYAVSRNWSMVPEYIRSQPRTITNFEEGPSPSVFYESKDELETKYRIIVCTLVTASRLVSAQFKRGHFTHIFIDESGHALEPECVIPVSGLLDPLVGQVVLAGDPKQLGPVIRSDLAKMYDLNISLLERLMTSPGPYKRSEDHYNNQYVTKLINNYRSHDAIISVPRELFYNNELVACADDVNLFLKWEHLPNKNFPIIFHPMYGKDEREENSPSFFNVAEVLEIDSYLKMILEEKRGGKRIRPQDIGIISPYRKQVTKIKEMIKKKGYATAGQLMVGSVEEFQGQEKLIIIISTVRSMNPIYLKMDRKFSLGFLSNPKRFNVAITRAKALLIVLGNPDMLEQDEHWGRFLSHCEENRALKVKRRSNESAVQKESIVDQLKNLSLEDGLDDHDDARQVSILEQQEAPGWVRKE